MDPRSFNWMTEVQPIYERSKTRPLIMPKLSPGIRVRYNFGQWSTPHSNADELCFVTNWATLPWAHTQTGVTVSDLEAQGGADWLSMGCGAWAVPDYATGLRMDDGRLAWVRTSCLDVVGYAEVAPNKRGEIQQELFT